MDLIDTCKRYFDAWIRHDLPAIFDTFAPGGTYRDPTTPGPIGGDALRGHIGGLWAAFPDLGFEIGAVRRLDERSVLGEWTMIGTNTGSFSGLPPSGKSVRLAGIDVIEVGSDGIRSVRGWFDSAELPPQPGLDAIVQPRAIGPFVFGVATTVRTGRPAASGVLAVTELIADSDDAVQEVRQLSRLTVSESLALPGFLSFTGSVAGRRMTTISIWDSVESMHSAMHSGTHAKVMRRFGELAGAGVTSVFAPQRIGPFLQRCPACGRVAPTRFRPGAAVSSAARPRRLPPVRSADDPGSSLTGRLLERLRGHRVAARRPADAPVRRSGAGTAPGSASPCGEKAARRNSRPGSRPRARWRRPAHHPIRASAWLLPGAACARTPADSFRRPA